MPSAMCARCVTIRTRSVWRQRARGGGAGLSRRGVSVDPDDVILTASTSESYSWLFSFCATPESGPRPGSQLPLVRAADPTRGGSDGSLSTRIPRPLGHRHGLRPCGAAVHAGDHRGQPEQSNRLVRLLAEFDEIGPFAATAHGR